MLASPSILIIRGQHSWLDIVAVVAKGKKESERCLNGRRLPTRYNTLMSVKVAGHSSCDDRFAVVLLKQYIQGDFNTLNPPSAFRRGRDY
ncbi:hypothetical protein J6590_090513 [Homalodisca vitripennis]|nr:hypothetical protein J6590_090513 [Homalodisca vitripennis]